MFWNKKKVDVSAVIQYRSDKDDEAAYEEEAKKAEKLMLSWFPKHLIVQHQKVEWNPNYDKRGTSSEKWEVLLNGSILIHTNVWINEGFVSKASAQKQEFIRAAIEGAMIGKPQSELDMYKKEVNAAKKRIEATAMSEANDYAVVAKKERLENEERVRKERAAKLVEIKRKESERLAAEAAETPAVKKVTKAKSKPKAKAKTPSQVKQSASANSAPAPATVKASTSDDGNNTTREQSSRSYDESTSAEVTSAAPSVEATVIEIQDSQSGKLDQPAALETETIVPFPANSSPPEGIHKIDKVGDGGPDAVDLDSGSTHNVDVLTAKKSKELKVLGIEHSVFSAVAVSMEPEPEPHACQKESLKQPENAFPAWAFAGFACCRGSRAIQDRAENDGPTFVVDDNLLIA